MHRIKTLEAQVKKQELDISFISKLAIRNDAEEIAKTKNAIEALIRKLSVRIDNCEKLLKSDDLTPERTKNAYNVMVVSYVEASLFYGMLVKTSEKEEMRAKAMDSLIKADIADSKDADKKLNALLSYFTEKRSKGTSILEDAVRKKIEEMDTNGNADHAKQE